MQLRIWTVVVQANKRHSNKFIFHTSISFQILWNVAKVSCFKLKELPYMLLSLCVELYKKRWQRLFNCKFQLNKINSKMEVNNRVHKLSKNKKYKPFYSVYIITAWWMVRIIITYDFSLVKTRMKQIWWKIYCRLLTLFTSE